jgi:carbamoyl-phosphate synthase small subunit
LSQKAYLTLEDKTSLAGYSFGFESSSAGEVVFNTGMVGYHETLTDPSYKGQILVLTYPLIGNYGVPDYKEDSFGLPIGFESSKIQIQGLIVSEYSAKYSHYSAVKSLSDWLKSEKIPALYNIDTRLLTKKLRSKGSMLGKIEINNKSVNLYDPNSTDLASKVSTKEIVNIDCGQSNAPTIAVIDCGCKANIIRSILNRGMNVIQVPYDYYFLNMNFDGLVISNGPGVIDNRCYITSQNHGYAVKEEGLPSDWKVSFKNANDQTVEGICHRSKPFSSVQFHPEATPGPVDTAYLFDNFAKQVKKIESKLLKL